MEVNKGYKQTEFGLIPVDWRKLKFEDVMTGFTSGATPYRGIVDYYKGNIRWITSGELNYNVITDTVEKITEEAVINTNLKMLPVGTFLIAITGLEAAGTRGSCGFVGAKATTNQSCMALFPKEDLDNQYLYHYYVWQGDTLAFKYCQGTKQQSYTGKLARILPIILPPTKEEQTAIATALSDADALINSLEKLIDKKQNIKQGAMQELLTGRRRLKGFSGDWNLKKLEDIADIDSDNLNSSTNPEYIFQYISLEDVDYGVLRSKSEVVFKNAPSRARRKVKKDDVLMSTVRPNLMSHLWIKDEVENWICSTGFAVIRSKENKADARFIFNHLFAFTVNKQIESLIGGSNYPAISSNDVKSLMIPVPSSMEEQSAISTILSDMDAEISALETKLVKYKKLKQGMMQNLLTGKIRLV